MSDNLHEQISAAYDTVVNGKTEEAVEDNEPEVEVSEEESGTPEVAEDAPEEDASDSNNEEEEDDIPVPEHWAKEDKEVFKSLDKRGKELLIRRHKEMEAGYTKKSQALSEEARLAENFKKTISPHEPYLRELGIDPLEAFNKLINAERILRTGSQEEKAIMIRNLATQYQADLNAEIDPIQYQNQIILQKMQELEEKQRVWARQKENEVESAYQSHIEAFASSKDEKGKPKYPHFDTVRQDMGLLMSAGKSDTLEEAYEQAILLNGDLRKEYLARQASAQSNAKKAIASKKAGFNVKSGSGGQISESKRELSMRELLSQAYDAQVRR